jgi:hypothetical protein
VLLPVIVRYQGLGIAKFFRGDAAFAGPKLLRLLEQEGFRSASCLPSSRHASWAPSSRRSRAVIAP